MKHVPKRRIQEIMTKIDCQQDFACYKSGFENLCRQSATEYDDSSEYTQPICINKENESCKMRVPHGNQYCCRCPLRLYVATYLNNLAALEGSSANLPQDPEKDNTPDS